MAERNAVTKTIATRYKRADKAGKARILDELCATTSWHRDHARKALRGAVRPRMVRARTPRPPKYGPKVIAALIFCWAVLGMPAGKRLAPILPELVPVLRRHDELRIDDDTAALLTAMSAATIDRRLAPERKKHQLKGRSHTKPGTLLKSQIPIRTWAQWDDAAPGFVEIDLVGHEGGNALGEHAYTLTVTDIATGWTENRSVRNKARKWVIAALDDIAASMPFPLLGIDSDNGSEFINHHLLAWCEDRKLTFTRSRPGNSNDGAHVEQKNWAIVRTVVGYHRYDTPAELLLLNKIWILQSLLTNCFQPQQKLISKVRDGAKVTKKYDVATTPHRRVHAHSAVSDETRAALADTYADINPAAVQRQIQALTTELLTLTTTKAGPAPKAAVDTGPHDRRDDVNANDVVAFLVEIIALVVWGTWAWHIAPSTLWARILSVVAIAGVAIVLWGLFAAPTATFDVPALAAAVRILVLGGSIFAAYALTSGPLLPTIWAVVVVVNTLLDLCRAVATSVTRVVG